MSQEQVRRDGEEAPILQEETGSHTVDVSTEKARVQKFSESVKSIGVKYGYNVDIDNEGNRVVILPEGDQVTLQPNESILVINGDANYRWIVETPEEIIQGIDKYKDDKGFSVMIINDMSTGKAISDVGEIDQQSGVIFLDVKRHNKAGK